MTKKEKIIRVLVFLVYEICMFHVDSNDVQHNLFFENETKGLYCSVYETVGTFGNMFPIGFYY